MKDCCKEAVAEREKEIIAYLYQLYSANKNTTKNKKKRHDIHNGWYSVMRMGHGQQLTKIIKHIHGKK